MTVMIDQEDIRKIKENYHNCQTLCQMVNHRYDKSNPKFKLLVTIPMNCLKDSNYYGIYILLHAMAFQGKKIPKYRSHSPIN